ncbi:unnamed protein product [Penicillium bialowiezense]
MYDIPDLQILARKYIEYFGKGISTIDILRLMKRIFSKLPEDETWLRSYLKRALQRSFASNNSRFYFNPKSCILNDHSSFTSAIMLLMIEIQSLHIEHLETGSMLNSTGEPTSTECLVVENMPIAPTEYSVSEDWLTPAPEDDTVVIIDETAVPEKEAVPEESLVEIPHGTYAITSQADPEKSLPRLGQLDNIEKNKYDKDFKAKRSTNPRRERLHFNSGASTLIHRVFDLNLAMTMSQCFGVPKMLC